MAADDALLDLLDRDPALVDDVVHETLRLTGREGVYSDEELAQLLHAFRMTLREALTGAGSEARDLMIQTAIPAVVAKSETPATLARSNTVFGILLATRVARVLPEEAGDGAVRWIAEFMAAWQYDTVEAADRARENG